MSDSRLRIKKARAAALVAEDRKTNEEIAQLVGVSERTVQRWRLEGEFQAAVEDAAKRLRRVAIDELLGSKQQRLSAIAESLTALNLIRSQRAVDPDLVDAPGGRTGMMTRKLRVLRTGPEDFETVQEFRVDYPWFREQRALLEHAAVELGQWIEKHETGFRRLKDLSEEELAMLVADGVDEFGQEAVDAADPH